MSELVEGKARRTLSENDQVGQDDLIQNQRLSAQVIQKETLHPSLLKQRPANRY